MKSNAWFVVMLLGVATLSFAQEKPGSAAKADLTEAQRLGRLVLQQRCSLCHNPQAVGRSIGPRLSKLTGTGQPADYVEKQILDGSANMPAFRYGLEPAEVAAVIDYLKGLEPVVPAKGQAGSNQANPD